MERVEIPLSKVKIVLNLLGAIAFAVLGYYLFATDMFYDGTGYWRQTFSPVLGRPIGFIAIFAFTGIALFMLYKLFSKEIGLTIDEKGFTDKSGGVALGFVAWEDVKGFDVIKVKSTRFMLVYIKHPQKYLSRYPALKQKWMGLNNKMYGTPFSITSTSLQCNFDELHSLLEKSLKNYKIHNK